jgi:hypothetical protein
MYEQTLYKVLDNHINPKVISKLNRYNKWEYGYNKDHDVIVISKTGKIGEIYEIQGLAIALPAENNTHKFELNRWEFTEYPKELEKIKTVFDWKEYSSEFQEKWFDYIDNEFKLRDEGFWFYNRSNPTYITGTHYMYLQWSKIDVGKPDFREANRLFFIFGKLAKRITDVTVCVTLKTVDLDFHLWHLARQLIKPQYQVTLDLGYYPSLDPMQRKCLRIK